MGPTSSGRRKKEEGRRKKEEGRKRIFPTLPLSPSPTLPSTTRMLWYQI
ncbi:hypothetical protein [Tychonema sp. LEGE 07203]|nr:hypothetical protein [Tychonema sp. LEGE 07203]MBE9096094.1 hypothetical protein [Tychonema sp. LEGE 07203]